MFQEQSFSHHDHAFTIEAEGWPNEEAAQAAILDLQMWTLRLDAAETASLHHALRWEAEALVHDAPYDRDTTPLPSVRAAQRHAVQSGLGGRHVEGYGPTLTLEAFQLASA